MVVFRNAGPLLTAVGENHIRGEQFTKNSLMALMMMIVGATIYGFNDLHFDGVGYMWATFNLVCNTCAGLFGKHLSMDLKTEQSGLGLACYQNIVSVPMFIFVLLACVVSILPTYALAPPSFPSALDAGRFLSSPHPQTRRSPCLRLCVYAGTRWRGGSTTC